MPRRNRTALAFLIVGLVAVTAAAFGGAFDETVTERISGGGTKLVHVDLVEVALGLAVRPNVISVDRGAHLVLEVENAGGETHDLAIVGGRARTRMLAPGTSQQLDLGTMTTASEAWCTVPGHKLVGMTLHIQVVSAGRNAPALSGRLGADPGQRLVGAP